MSDDPKEHLRGKLSFVVKSINDQFLVVSNHCLHIKYINFLVKFLTGTCKEYNIHSKVYMLTLIWHCRSPYLNSVDSHQESWWRDMSQQQNNELFTWGDMLQLHKFLLVSADTFQLMQQKLSLQFVPNICPLVWTMILSLLHDPCNMICYVMQQSP